MADFNTTLNGLASQFGLTLKWLLFVLLLLLLLGAVGYFVAKRRRWNMKVEFKLRRSDGKAIYSEIGRGSYRPSRGFAIIKRPGIAGKKYEIKNFDSTLYLQGGDVLTVVQVGSTEMMPVIPDSFQEVIDEKTGHKAMLMNLKGDVSKDRAWAAMRTRDLLNAYTIRSFFAQNGQMLGFGLLLLILIIGLFLGFGMILDRLPKP